ncbi:hypothetical protein ACHAW5_002860 [Stephanodiscus triporus]|uniref:Calmodulin n=1 Tax=Stephanodiscus triporus TaxID=2934178 RepID=A0ABD3Q078_9STRA
MTPLLLGHNIASSSFGRSSFVVVVRAGLLLRHSAGRPRLPPPMTTRLPPLPASSRPSSSSSSSSSSTSAVRPSRPSSFSSAGTMMTSFAWCSAVSIATAAVTTTTTTTTTSCDDGGGGGGGGGGNENNNVDALLSRVRAMMSSLERLPPVPKDIDEATLLLASFVRSGIPESLSYGFLAGYVSGYALRKVGRISAALLGASFLVMQALSNCGYVEVNHDRVRETVEGLLDRNGDGKVDVGDLRSCVEQARRMAGFGIVDDRDRDDDGKGRGEEEEEKRKKKDGGKEVEEEGKGGGGGGGRISANNGGAYASAGGFTLGFYGGLRSG